MNMIPGKILSVPIYSTSGVIAMAGLIFVVPGGLFIMGALVLCWLADRITSDKSDHIDTTIEEYEEVIGGMSTYGDIADRSNSEMWADFYDDPMFKEEDIHDKEKV